MITGSGLFLVGISGFLIFFAVLAHLSARMGEGLHLPPYYRIYYIALLFLILAALYVWYIYSGEGFEDMMLVLLIIGNALAVVASYKYWWWLKDELWIKKDIGEISNE